MRPSSQVAKWIHNPCEEHRLGKGAVVGHKQNTQVWWITKCPELTLKGYGFLPFWPANSLLEESVYREQTVHWLLKLCWTLNLFSNFMSKQSHSDLLFHIQTPYLKQLSHLEFSMQREKVSFSAAALLHQYTDLSSLNLLDPCGRYLQILLPGKLLEKPSSAELSAHSFECSISIHPMESCSQEVALWLYSIGRLWEINSVTQ